MPATSTSWKVKHEPLQCTECQGEGWIEVCGHGSNPDCWCKPITCCKCGGGGGVKCIDCGEFEAVDGLDDVFCLVCEEKFQTAERWRAMCAAKEQVRNVLAQLELGLQDLPRDFPDRTGVLTATVELAIAGLRETQKTLEVLQ